MLLDPTQEYTPEKKEYLADIWGKIIQQLVITHEPIKISSFLGKCGVIGIDEKNLTIYIGIPNEFVLTQVKKFFGSDMKEAVKDVYNNQYTVKYTIYEPFQAKKKDDLQIDLTKVLQLNTKSDKLDAKLTKGLTESFGILFDSQYTFSNCVVGDHNKLAVGAGQAIANNPGTAYNPFFIYGNVGLWKTMLMQAIGNAIAAQHRDKVTVYLPVTKMVDEIVDAIKKNKINSFMEKMEHVDVLMIDDVQFLADKTKTQEIFHNIFNDFYSRNKQIILTSDRPPKELDNIAERLKSRFSNGLVADISQPDYETRIAILQSKCRGYDIPNPVLALIAQHIKSNVRELEGALNLLITRHTLTGQDITIDDAHATLKTLGYQSAAKKDAPAPAINTKSADHFQTTLETIAKYYGVTSNDLVGDSRKKEISQARQLAMYIAKKNFNRTLEKIGNYFGGKNHASVIYSVNTFEERLKHEPQVGHDYQVIADGLA